MKTPARKRPDIPYILLRVGLAGVFLYAAIDAFREPLAWTPYVPHFTTHVLAAKDTLYITSVVQVGMALLLLANRYVRYVAALAALQLATILAFNLGALYELFRDFGLLAMALALVFWER